MEGATGVVNRKAIRPTDSGLPKQQNVCGTTGRLLAAHTVAARACNGSGDTGQKVETSCNVTVCTRLCDHASIKLTLCVKYMSSSA